MTDFDIPGVLKIERTCFSIDPWNDEIFETCIENGDIISWVVEEKKEIAAYLVGSDREEFGHLLNIAVSPDYRQRGIGSSLIKRWNTLAEEKGWIYSILEVRKSNAAAIEMYRKNRFEPLEEVNGFYPDGEPALIMVCWS